MFGQDNNIKKQKKKAGAQNEVAKKRAFDNNKTKPPYVVAKSDNKQYIAARCRRHGSDLHASCGESSDLVFRLKQQLNLP